MILKHILVYYWMPWVELCIYNKKKTKPKHSIVLLLGGNMYNILSDKVEDTSWNSHFDFVPNM